MYVSPRVCASPQVQGMPRESLRAPAQIGWTALMYAADGGYGDVITALLEAHASTELLDNVRVAACVRVAAGAAARNVARAQGGWTALMYAVKGGHGDVVTALLESHANTELRVNVRVAVCVRVATGAAARVIARARRVGGRL